MRSVALSFVVLATGLVVPPAALGQFADVTAVAGVEVVGVRDGAACFGDVDRDGDYDMYVPRDTGSVLLLNDGGGVFQDVTATVISGLSRRVADLGCAFADFNNDGWVDLARTGPVTLEVYLNRGDAGGMVTFGDDSQDPNFVLDGSDAAIADPFPVEPEGLGVFDYNGDDYLDLALQNEGGVRLLENDGDGTFSPTSGTGLPGGTGGDGDYLAVADFDMDGDVDILPRLPDDGDIFANDGDGTFTEVPPDLAADDVNKGGTIVCDFNNDGRFDLFFTNGVVDAALVDRVLLQDAGGDFTATPGPDISGVNVEGGACGDVDHDGDLDLAVNLFDSTGLYINQLAESGSFSLTRDDRGIVANARSRGMAFTDVDGDGDLDLFTAKTGPYNGTVFEDGPNFLFRNDTDDTNYLMVRVFADVGSCPGGPILREDLGAIVQLLDAGGALLATREISGGADRSRTEAALAHFGIPAGPAQTYQVRVRFQVGGGDVTVPVVPANLGSPQRVDIISSDPDGDSIPTEIEMQNAGANPDLDADGLDAWVDADADGDGFGDAIEAGDSDPCTPPADLDANGVPDYLEATTVPPDAGLPLVDGGGVVVPPVDGGVLDAGSADAGPIIPLTPGLELRGGGVASCGVTPRQPTIPSALAAIVILFLRRRGRRR